MIHQKWKFLHINYLLRSEFRLLVTFCDSQSHSQVLQLKNSPSAYRVDAHSSHVLDRNVDNVILQTYKQEHIWF